MHTFRIPGAEGRRTLVRDLRNGHAGWLVRAGLSLASAAAILSVAMVCLGLFELTSGGWIRDEHVALTMGVAAAAWCGALTLLWWSYRRFQVTLKAVFAVAATWAIVLPTAFIVDSMMSRGEGYMIGALVCLGIAVSIGLIVMICYHRHRAGAAARAIVRVRMACPECGYSLVGLADCRCPECGAQYTVDTLVEALGRGQVVTDDSTAPPETTPLLESSPPMLGVMPEPEPG